MKTKLLKKVRKRYRITKIEIFDRRGKLLRYNFILKDIYGKHKIQIESKDKEWLLRVIRSWISEDYSHTHKEKVNKTKAWY